MKNSGIFYSHDQVKKPVINLKSELGEQMKHKTGNKGSLLKIGEAAEILHVSPQTLRDWTEAGKIEATLSDKGHRKYYEADVHKTALKEQGITSYWTADRIVAISASDDKYYYLNPKTYQLSPEAHVYTTEFDRFWNFTNGLEAQAHLAALNKETVIIEPETLDAFPLEIADKPGMTFLAQSVIIVGLDRAKTEQAIHEAAAKTFKHLKENFKPQQTTIWFANNGELVTP